MDALVRALGRFAARDIPYLIGGMSVILAFLTLIEIPFPTDPSTAQLLLFVGIAYPVGYVVPEAISLTGLLNTSIVLKDKRLLPLLKPCFRRWARKGWSVPPDFNAHSAYYRMYAKPADEVAPIERVMFLEHIGTAIGSSWLICALLFAGSWSRTGNSKFLVVAATALVLSLLLILFGWLQLMEANLALCQSEEAPTSRAASAGLISTTASEVERR